MTRLSLLARVLLPLACILHLGDAAAITAAPLPNEDVCADDRAASYALGFADGDARGSTSYGLGFADGDTNGFNRGYPLGYTTGYTDGYNDGSSQRLAQCLADPLSCGITLELCLPDPAFGETEPNDNLIAADPLKLDARYSAQSYGLEDEDWYYFETKTPNENVIVNFSVPDWIFGAADSGNPGLSGETSPLWRLTIRDAAGNVFASFLTNVYGGVQSPRNAMTYTATLGLVGTYYLMVEPVECAEGCGLANNVSYSIAASTQASGLEGQQPIIGFVDAESEPNNVPSAANPLATTVAMYGLINLTFEGVVESGTESVWGQGEYDWYVYYSKGNEIITLSFCAREQCGPGNWYVEVYDKSTADAWETLTNAGETTQSLKPLLAFNTDNAQEEPETFRLGLRDPGYYFVKVLHKRLFDAPCNAYRLVKADGGFVEDSSGYCDCGTELAEDISQTQSSCYIPSDNCSNEELGLLCRRKTEECNPGIEPGCLLADGNEGRPQIPPDCPLEEELGEGGVKKIPCETYVTAARCACYRYGGVVEIPENEYTSPYNFTWHSTKLPANTINTEAYEQYLKRANQYD